MTARGTATTFAKGLKVLQCFETGQRGLTMAEVARLTGLDKAAARRLCLTLLDCGYLVQNGRALELTARNLSWGAGYLAAHDFGRTVQPVLDRFAEELDSEIALAVLDGDRAIYAARSATSAARVSIGFSVGSRLPLFPTAIGRMLLAQLPQGRRAALLAAQDIRPFTAATELDAAAISDAVEEAARSGACRVKNQFEMGASAVAVACGHLGGAPTALGTTASANAFDDTDHRDRVLDILRRAALAIGFQRQAA